ncbi:Imidazoleglycerol-phosphate dehydratase [Frankliniella fusca]|uniref:Imidazoleglycerol-phosphate dehydratase n=1 Tax=Frankliniella fusca TaxID=407009 RepID=A0AAE1H2G9_9NEOP|nr:Imidazoleglycerol-phosphate dehydratase [Frankliniella fusca]
MAAESAKVYFKRLCKWDNVDYSEVKIFGHELAPIDDAVSQVALFETQGIQGPMLVPDNAFYLNALNEPQENNKNWNLPPHV